jgi:CRP/FNR family cyclic AMP-dependent transcriptional regulator
MRRGRVKREAKLQLLGDVPLFAGCSKAELRWIAGITGEESFEPGADVVREGDVGWDFFVIVEGEATVRRGARKVNAIGPGDFFGEIALVTEVTRTATVVAATPLLVLTIVEMDFRELLLEQPSIAQKVLRSLGERVAADAG